MTTPSAVLPAAVASVSEVRNQVAEALRRLDELVGASPPGEPSSSATAYASSVWELIGRVEPMIEHRYPAPTYAKALWKRAVKKISMILRLRQRWSDLGRLLQKENSGKLCDHLERVNGVLRHKIPQPTKGSGRQGPRGYRA